ncbi:MAG: dTMP kinase [Cyanobacteria bacterium P01_A01_bin.114]
MIGKLIVFEGIEGCGKTTQLARLCEWLPESDLWAQLRSHHPIQGILSTREPGGTVLGQSIRDLLLHPPADSTPQDRTELLLYAADRAQHVDAMIRPALKEGYLVICDRYTDSTVAYQGYGRQLDLALIETLNQIATGGLESDLTVWLRLDVEAGLSRMKSRGQADRIEKSGIAFHKRVQTGFEALAQQHSHRFVSIDGSDSIDAVADKIRSVVTTALQTWYPLP